MARIPRHWAGPTGVPSYKKDTHKETCFQCGREHYHSHIIGNIDYPEDRFFCSSHCAKEAHNRWMGSRAVGIDY
jgi:hypothetical protein